MTQQPYAINNEPKFAPLSVIDIHKLQQDCKGAWVNQSLCHVNDADVRLGVVKGEFHWHKHDNEEEFFYVVDGRLYIDLENQTVELSPQQGFTVPRGTLHRTRAPERVVVLMVEKRTVNLVGD